MTKILAEGPSGEIIALEAEPFDLEVNLQELIEEHLATHLPRRQSSFRYGDSSSQRYCPGMSRPALRPERVQM